MVSITVESPFLYSLKEGDRIIFLETARDWDVIHISIRKVEKKASDISFISSDIVPAFWLNKKKWNYKLRTFFKYFRRAEFICRIASLLNSAYLYKVASDDDVQFVEALRIVPSTSRIWAKICNLYPEEMVRALKPYLLSYKLGRKESGK